LPETIALERFESIARRYPQIVEPARDLKLAKLASREGLDAHEPLDAPAAGEGFRVSVPERDDHVRIVTRGVINVKRDNRVANGGSGLTRKLRDGAERRSL
jgi:hypothetical protein